VLRVGFIGAGLIATFHSKMLRRSGVEVVRAGVHDPDLARASAFAAASGHHVCASEDEVLDGCDAVYVCTWTSEHPRLVAEAARRRIHIFCEKPLATDLAGAEAMLDTVQRAGITHQVGLILRRSPAYVWARQLIEDPAAGRVMAVVFRDDQYIPVQGMYASTWRGDRTKAGGGTMLEHSIHDVDMLRFLTGGIEAVSANSSAFHRLDGIEDVMAVSLRFLGGGAGTLTSIWHDNLARPSLRRVEVFCERRYIHLDGDDWFGPVHWTDADGTNESLAGEALVGAAAPLVEGDVNPDAAFVRAAVAGAPAWPDFATGVVAHRVVDAIYRSAALDGQSVEVDA